MDTATLPAVNACLNLTATFFLAAGYFYIRRHRHQAHRNCMLSATFFSALFLICYLYYHFHAGHRPFSGQNPTIRIIYFSILLSHIVLAITIVPLVLFILYQAFVGNFDRHRRVARWTWPLWMYVSVTGVIVYLMLYQLF